MCVTMKFNRNARVFSTILGMALIRGGFLTFTVILYFHFPFSLCSFWHFLSFSVFGPEAKEEKVRSKMYVMSLTPRTFFTWLQACCSVYKMQKALPTYSIATGTKKSIKFNDFSGVLEYFSTFYSPCNEELLWKVDQKSVVSDRQVGKTANATFQAQKSPKKLVDSGLVVTLLETSDQLSLSKKSLLPCPEKPLFFSKQTPEEVWEEFYEMNSG